MTIDVKRIYQKKGNSYIHLIWIMFQLSLIGVVLYFVYFFDFSDILLEDALSGIRAILGAVIIGYIVGLIFRVNRKHKDRRNYNDDLLSLRYSDIGIHTKDKVFPWSAFAKAEKFKNEQGEVLALRSNDRVVIDFFTGRLKPKDINLRNSTYGTPMVLYFHDRKPRDKSTIADIIGYVEAGRIEKRIA